MKPPNETEEGQGRMRDQTGGEDWLIVERLENREVRILYRDGFISDPIKAPEWLDIGFNAWRDAWCMPEVFARKPGDAPCP